MTREVEEEEEEEASKMAKQAEGKVVRSVSFPQGEMGRGTDGREERRI